jgi:hypothetical protein
MGLGGVFVMANEPGASVQAMFDSLIVRVKQQSMQCCDEKPA